MQVIKCRLGVSGIFRIPPSHKGSFLLGRKLLKLKFVVLLALKVGGEWSSTRDTINTLEESIYRFQLKIRITGILNDSHIGSVFCLLYILQSVRKSIIF